MKTFRWVWLAPLGNEDKKFASIMEIKEGAERIVKIHGSIAMDGKVYRPLVSGQTVDEDILTLKEAKEAVEKRLFDDGVIADGDKLEDWTEKEDTR